MKRQTIDQFFKPKIIRTETNVVASTNAVESPSFEEREVPCSSSSIRDRIVTVTDVNTNSADIGVVSDKLFCSGKSLTLANTRDLKYKVLNNVFVPSETFAFPTSDFNKKKLKFQRNWLGRWSWLAYSKEKDAAYCKYCVLFGREYVGKGANQKLGSLVSSPFKKWKDAIEKFNLHNDTDYHKFSTVAADNFLKVNSGQMDDVATLLDSQRSREREQNRSSLKPIIESIIFCGENEIPLRGHRDSGPLTIAKPLQKEGKFRALLRFRASTDEKLKQHVLESARNATYISPDIQNEIIGICGDLIQKNLIQAINNAKCFTILGDETLDVSGKEQFSLCIRYISKDAKPILREDFISFTQITDLSAENIFQNIVGMCNNLGLNMEKLVGQGYDGCSTFSGHINGVHQRLQEIHPKAIYVHCAAHRLNLVLSDSLSVTSIRNCLGTVSEISNIFRNNALANDLLKKNISNLVPGTKKTRLLGLCETRFIERQDAVNTFIELFAAIAVSLQDLSNTDRAISSTASTLLAAIEKGSFLVGLVICEFVFSITLPLSKYLQKPECDLSSALKHADDIISMLQGLRQPENPRAESDVQNFTTLFEKAESLARDNFGTVIHVPRQAGHQSKRENPPHNTPEEYFRRSMFIPCLDSLISGLVNRFNKNRDILEAFEVLLPKNLNPAKVESLQKLRMYYDDRTSEAAVESEYLLWCQKWRECRETERPKKIMEILDQCSENFYPNINFLLQVLATLPVSTAEVERSFSSLKRIKSYVRNSMENDRLTGLALMSIHYPVSITAEEVLDAMARSGKRKLLL